jgi:hypothetical protein
MTRIIIAATPAYGHVAPLRTIAADLVRRGEHVTFLTASSFRTSIEETGARFVALPAAADFDIAELVAQHPERADLEPGPAAISWDMTHVFIEPPPSSSCSRKRTASRSWSCTTPPTSAPCPWASAPPASALPG